MYRPASIPRLADQPAPKDLTALEPTSCTRERLCSPTGHGKITIEYICGKLRDCYHWHRWQPYSMWAWREGPELVRSNTAAHPPEVVGDGCCCRVEFSEGMKDVQTFPMTGVTMLSGGPETRSVRLATFGLVRVNWVL